MIGVLGLGRMGGAMAARLAGLGEAVCGWDAEAEARARAEAAGVALAEPPAAPVVLLSLPHEAAVAAALPALLAAMPKGGVIADTSTIAPEAARRFAALCAASGVDYLDAPVSGGPAGAAGGTMAMMIGGEVAALERARPVLERLATRIVHVGASGAGQVAKLANNLLVATHLMAAAEALRMADAAGVAPEALLPVINAASGRSAATEVNWPRWIASGSFDSGFAAGLMRKDVRLALRLADAARTPLSVCAAAARLWEELPVPDEAEFNRAPHALFTERSHG